MEGKNSKSNRAKRLMRRALSVITICFVSTIIVSAQTGSAAEKLAVTANFSDREISANEQIQLDLNRNLAADEGRIAIFIGNTDFTSLFLHQPQGLSYQPGIVSLPVGENPVTVYTITPNNEWKIAARFSLKVKAISSTAETADLEGKEATPAGATSRKTVIEFTPNLTLNVKSQNQILTFPRETAPERNPFTDVDGQGNLQFKISRNNWALTNKFDFVGVSFQPNALRFSELRERAPNIDLSSYLIELTKGRFNARLGHVSFGSNRHLINNFSSRGISATLPLGKQNEISLAAMNGTSIVGFSNFFGFTRAKHSLISTTFAREFIAERPGAFRVELSLMRGSILPLSSFNQGKVTDAEKSQGFGIKVIGNNFKQRLRYELGFTRSRFTNPPDPSLEQGLEVKPVRPVTRNARYAEISFDFLQGLELWREKKLKVTGTFRHEEIEPLFRSLAVATQADRRQNQFEVSATFGEINFAYGNLRDRDNLRHIPSILETINHRRNIVVGVALNSFFTPKKPNPWLPRIGYTFDQTHQFGAFFPVDGDFRDPSQIPDQENFSHNFNADWQLTSRLRVGYRHNRAFQNNKQPGRERADFLTEVNAVNVGTTFFKSLDWNFDISHEQLKNFEQPRTDRTLRIGSGLMWRTPFLKNSTFNANFSTTFSGDTGNQNRSRNLEFDAQWAYQFNFGKEKFKKLGAQFFVRYANRYGDVSDRLFSTTNFNKTQSFNTGLTINFF